MPLGWGFVHSFKAPGRGDWGFCILAMLIHHSSQPPPNQFSCLSQNTLQKDQESPQNELQWLEQNTGTWKFCRESLLMVYKRDWVYLLLCQRPICETGSNNIYIKGSCLMSFERIFKRCKYMHVAGTIITSLLTNNDNLYQCHYLFPG